MVARASYVLKGSRWAPWAGTAVGGPSRGGGAGEKRWGRGATAGRAEPQGGEGAAGPAGGGAAAGRAGQGRKGVAEGEDRFGSRAGVGPTFPGALAKEDVGEGEPGLCLGSQFELRETKTGFTAGETSFRSVLSPHLCCVLTGWGCIGSLNDLTRWFCEAERP